MPLVDMSLEKLYQYRGTNPKPDDFDSYWERALAEMEAQDPKVELTKPAFAAPDFAEAFDLWFTGVGGSRIHAIYERPKGKKNCPVILFFHGYSGACHDYHSLLNYVGTGFCVASLDCRGQGGRSQDTVPVAGNTLHGHIIRGLEDPDPDKLYYRNAFLDTALLAKVVASFEETDGERMGCVGGSQGGGLTFACAALVPAIRVGCASAPFLSDYKRVWDMDLAKGAYGELCEFFRHTDPLHEKETEYFTKLGYIDVHNLAPRIRGKMYMFTGMMDTTCPPSTQFAAYNALTCEKQVTLYPDFGHEEFPGRGDMVYQIFCRELL